MVSMFAWGLPLQHTNLIRIMTARSGLRMPRALKFSVEDVVIEKLVR